jgi:hypothetical protein
MRTSLHHQSEAQPPNGPLTAATSPDTPSRMSSQAVGSRCGSTPENLWARAVRFHGPDGMGKIRVFEPPLVGGPPWKADALAAKSGID